jgi:hypothetical protein
VFVVSIEFLRRRPRAVQVALPLEPPEWSPEHVEQPVATRGSA